MTIDELKSKKVAVLGFGHEGQALVRYFSKHGIPVSVHDAKKHSEINATQSKMVSEYKLQTHFGENYLDNLSEMEVVFKSPGINLSDQFKNTLREKEIFLTSQTAWFFKHCPSKIIGITGTKGKGTTSSLLFEMLTAGNLSNKVYLTGNIGKESPLDFLDQTTSDDFIVFELSSFQLEGLEQSPNIGICLMVTEDHLDYHPSLDLYHQAKQSITKFQGTDDIAIYNIDYPASKSIGVLGKGQKFEISKSKAISLGARIDLQTEQIIITTNSNAVKIDVKNRIIRGKHNLENIAAASLAATILGVSNEVITQTIQNFSGLPHRLELTGEFDGIKFYDDSIATNPDTALAGLAAFSEPVTLLLGGANKGLDYTNLISKISQCENLKAVVCFGQVGELLYSALNDSGFQKSLEGPFLNFDEAVKSAISVSTKGDVVLLSPAATSFDMFNSYSERGDAFKQLVKNHYAQS
ncbi:MAG TPA: UDP-N-acetylmuramoyl-L-alanine--D-glutamate ligase [Candidatus Doudnabacteria bacterium]|nr:UDP-N-acetylmuramoyl-L-alanine--D-glutamate ligase [Candidatus Doudnabacteria bacterium]